MLKNEITALVEDAKTSSEARRILADALEEAEFVYLRTDGTPSASITEACLRVLRDKSVLPNHKSPSLDAVERWLRTLP